MPKAQKVGRLLRHTDSYGVVTLRVLSPQPHAQNGNMIIKCLNNVVIYTFTNVQNVCKIKYVDKQP